MKPEWLSVTVTVLLMITAAYLAAGVRAVSPSRLRRASSRGSPRPTSSPPASAECCSTPAPSSTAGSSSCTGSGSCRARLRVPRFVLSELQTLADSADDNRRATGRRGLDLLASLPAETSVEVFEADYPETPQVDDKLMRLAVDAKSAIVTVDYNLAKVARVRGIEVLNLNDAASALRPTYLPGENIRLRIAKSGKEAEQGVGYLDDGTMVVVQGGRSLVGRDSRRRGDLGAPDLGGQDDLRSRGRALPGDLRRGHERTGRALGGVGRAAVTAASVGAIVVAGGSGERLGREGGKQLAVVAGLPVLSWTVKALAETPEIDVIVARDPSGACRRVPRDRGRTAEHRHTRAIRAGGRVAPGLGRRWSGGTS